VLPILYLRGLSTGDFAPALGEFFGTEAGLSASTITRLTESLEAEHVDCSAGTSTVSTTCTGGWTASTSTSASRTTGCARW
jgi:hypothetical protein